jgi:hypothetical protein
MLMMSYRQLDSAYAIGTTGPVRIGFSGRLIATDHSRKWTPWRRPMNSAALMVRTPGKYQPVFMGGNGQQVGSRVGYGNVYTLNPAQYTDDDYGLIVPYYITAFLPGKDLEEATQLGGYRKLLIYVMTYCSGLGNLLVTPYVNNLQNAWPITATRALVAAPTDDIEFAGCSAQGNRIALKFASLPNAPSTPPSHRSGKTDTPPNTDNTFNLQRLTAFVRKHPLQVRGAA